MTLPARQEAKDYLPRYRSAVQIDMMICFLQSGQNARIICCFLIRQQCLCNKALCINITVIAIWLIGPSSEITVLVLAGKNLIHKFTGNFFQPFIIQYKGKLKKTISPISLVFKKPPWFTRTGGCSFLYLRLSQVFQKTSALIFMQMACNPFSPGLQFFPHPSIRPYSPGR